MITPTRTGRRRSRAFDRFSTCLPPESLMRIDGKLSKWNDDRGFGFIMPNNGGQEIFVHISAFPRDGRRPLVGEPLSFEIELGADGKKRANAVTRPRPAGADRPARPTAAPRTRGPRSPLGRLLPPIALAILGLLGYQHFEPHFAGAEVERPGSATAHANPTAEHDEGAETFRCDGRTHCSQMRSCAEAKYFLRNCPGTQMDGNYDGVPCESQWCSGPFD